MVYPPSENKKPAQRISRQRAGTPKYCGLHQLCNLRCTSPPSRSARDGDGDDGNETTCSGKTMGRNRSRSISKIAQRIDFSHQTDPDFACSSGTPHPLL